MHNLGLLTIALSYLVSLGTPTPTDKRQVLGAAYIPLTPATAHIGVLWTTNGPASTISGCLNNPGNVILTTNVTKSCPLFTARLSADKTASKIVTSAGAPCIFGAAKYF